MKKRTDWLHGGKNIVLVVMANVIFVLKFSWSFWRENVVIFHSQSQSWSIFWREKLPVFGANSCLFLAGKITCCFWRKKCRLFLEKVSWSFWRENVVISQAKSELINFFGGNNYQLFLAGKNVVFSLRKSADLVCIVRQWCIPFTTSGARNSVRSICLGWPGSFSLLNFLQCQCHGPGSVINWPPRSGVPDPRIRTFD